MDREVSVWQHVDGRSPVLLAPSASSRGVLPIAIRMSHRLARSIAGDFFRLSAARRIPLASEACRRIL